MFGLATKYFRERRGEFETLKTVIFIDIYATCNEDKVAHSFKDVSRLYKEGCGYFEFYWVVVCAGGTVRILDRRHTVQVLEQPSVPAPPKEADVQSQHLETLQKINKQIYDLRLEVEQIDMDRAKEVKQIIKALKPQPKGAKR